LTRIMVYGILFCMGWRIVLKESVLDDLRWLGRRESRSVLNEAAERLSANPRHETRHMKRLRPNPVAQRELRLFGKYRVLFNVDVEEQVVRIVLVGEKRGEKLIVRGEEFTEHESGTPE
jgi:mRNA-degrading endonuclease RelE of RelBE toxin-antitoxin system